MTPEERFERMERQMEFLAQNQAELTANVGTLKQDLLALARIVQQHVVSTEARFQTVAESGSRRWLSSSRWWPTSFRG